MRLNDKIQFEENGEMIICTATFCYIEGRKKPGIFWVDQNFCYWKKDSIPENHTIIQKGNQVNSSLLYQPNDVSVENKEWIEQIHANWEMLAQIDKKQKEKGDTLYRYVSFPCADGQSVYQITKITRSTATLSLVTGIGDDWDIFGENTVMELETVINNIKRRDQLADLFNK